MKNWSKETPTKEGWYWITYPVHKGKRSVCPCSVMIIGEATIVRSAFGASFVEGPNHGGKGLKENGKLAKGVLFGPEIPLPDIEELT